MGNHQTEKKKRRLIHKRDRMNLSIERLGEKYKVTNIGGKRI